jgi:hypothetical protein
LLDAEEHSGAMHDETKRQSIGHDADRFIDGVDTAMRALVRAEGQ